ncbi:hypothetical protein [uncultured Campylobacter sp.]|uniref:hypothetical protein n=1 Tax=uncultured Campylobacter sp. TaxID=218934 RepID=UPI00260AA4BC|nr:hypothetical protein [uncultured Campylobacter sp.]
MDSIKFYLNDYESNGESLTEVVVAINGEPLLELIKRREQSFAAKDGQASIAGDYAYLSLIDFKKLFLDALSPNGRLAASGERSVVLLGCPCGIWNCWYLALMVKFETETVKLYEFKNPRRKDWQYGLEFKFDRVSFVSEISKIASFNKL